MPAIAKFALEMAFTTPITFRFTHGISTNPATGSQTNPSKFFNAIAQAFPQASGVPPRKNVNAAAAIAEAAPISA